MRKRFRRVISLMTAFTIVLGSAAKMPAAAADTAAGAATSADSAADAKSGDTASPDSVPTDPVPSDADAAGGQDAAGSENNGQESPDMSESPGDAAGGAGAAPDAGASNDAGAAPAAGAAGDQGGTDGQDAAPETGSSEKDEDISGSVKTDEDISGTVTVEQDKNDDKVEIKKNDKPYLALGTDLTEQQRATVLALMGIDAGALGNYDVVMVNNAEEHQYLDHYIDKSKIGSKSLSSIVIVEREEGNGINISTNNITYCTVGMYKNALATAGIKDADIIVAAPFPISGTAALVGVFKAYKEMTGDEIDEENIDAALNELVVTGELEAGGASSDDIEGMIAYVKQAVVEHDLSDESEIRDAIAKGCEKFGLTLTDEEREEVVQLMKKIGELDLDLDSLLNAAQSIYDKIANADGGFWAKIRELLSTLWDKIRELF